MTSEGFPGVSLELRGPAAVIKPLYTPDSLKAFCNGIIWEEPDIFCYERFVCSIRGSELRLEGAGAVSG